MRPPHGRGQGGDPAGQDPRHRVEDDAVAEAAGGHEDEAGEGGAGHLTTTTSAGLPGISR